MATLLLLKLFGGEGAAVAAVPVVPAKDVALLSTPKVPLSNAGACCLPLPLHRHIRRPAGACEGGAGDGSEISSGARTVRRAGMRCRCPPATNNFRESGLSVSVPVRALRAMSDVSSDG